MRSPCEVGLAVYPLEGFKLREKCSTVKSKISKLGGGVKYTLPEINSSHLKIDVWKTILSFSGANGVSFRKCTFIFLAPVIEIFGEDCFFLPKVTLTC